MAEVPAVPTPTEPALQGALLTGAWGVVLGQQPTRAVAELTLAQLLLENASGKSLYNYNFGNLTGSGGDWYLNPKVKAPLKFKSYDQPDEGMLDYVRLIRRTSLYSAAQSGDAKSYASAILSSNYTPGIDVDAVANSLAATANTIRSRGYLDTELPGPGVQPSRFPALGAACFVGGLIAAWWASRVLT